MSILPTGGARATLADAGHLDLLIIDGYVTLDPSGRPGLGAHAHAEFGVPVIGVAKTRFAPAVHAIPVTRGTATRPLYVTAAGVPPAEAAELVRTMTGKFRIPGALRRADTLARGRPLQPSVAEKLADAFRDTLEVPEVPAGRIPSGGKRSDGDDGTGTPASCGQGVT